MGSSPSSVCCFHHTSVFHPGGRPTSSAEGDRQPDGLRSEAAVQKCL